MFRTRSRRPADGVAGTPPAALVERFLLINPRARRLADGSAGASLEGLGPGGGELGTGIMAIQTSMARKDARRARPVGRRRAGAKTAVLAWLRRELAKAQRDQQDAHFLATARGERYRPWT